MKSLSHRLDKPALLCIYLLNSRVLFLYALVDALYCRWGSHLIILSPFFYIHHIIQMNKKMCFLLACYYGSWKSCEDIYNVLVIIRVTVCQLLRPAVTCHCQIHLIFGKTFTVS